LPRDKEKVRRRLQEAALKLYQHRGYEVTTAAEIAAEAGVTERTFFRHFADKREVLFGGDTVLSEALTRAVLDAPKKTGPWDTLFGAFRSVEYLFVENRPFSEPRRLIIAGSPALQERAQAKVRSLVAALASALCQRGVPHRVASLTAQIGMATLGYAVDLWLDDASGNLDDYVVQAFREVRDLPSLRAEAPHRRPAAAKK